MTDPRPRPIFRTTGAAVAFVTLTMTAAIVFTDVRCPKVVDVPRAGWVCRQVVMALPGEGRAHTVQIVTNATRSGRGRVVPCRKCGSLCEVVEL